MEAIVMILVLSSSAWLALDLASLSLGRRLPTPDDGRPRR